MTFNLPKFRQHLAESVETLETQISFDYDSTLKLKIMRYLSMAEIPTGAIKVEQNMASKKTYIRIFNLTVPEVAELLNDESIASKISVKDTSRDVEPEFNNL